MNNEILGAFLPDLSGTFEASLTHMVHVIRLIFEPKLALLPFILLLLPKAVRTNHLPSSVNSNLYLGGKPA